MSRKGKAREEEHENIERWLITYADMITLLMAFFIMMYAMSVVNKGKFAALAVSVRTGFGGPIAGALPEFLQIIEASASKPGMLPPDDYELLTAASKFIRRSLGPTAVADFPGRKSARKTQSLSEQVTVVARDRDLVVRVAAGPVTFPRGSAELTPAARRIVDAVARLVARLPNHIRIEGHTCNLPIHTARFPSNWELSAQRAINVLTYLVRHGIEPSRLSAVGFADTVPLVPNIDEAHRRKNRRVDIVIIGALSGTAKSLTASELRAASATSEEDIQVTKPDITPHLDRSLVPVGAGE